MLPDYNKHYSEEQNKRFLVRPEVTGLAKITGRNELTWNEKFFLDVEYVETLSFVDDFKVLVGTVCVVLCSKGSRKSGEDKKFTGNIVGWLWVLS